jgi:hypothetical protein
MFLAVKNCVLCLDRQPIEGNQVSLEDIEGYDLIFGVVLPVRLHERIGDRNGM